MGVKVKMPRAVLFLIIVSVQVSMVLGNVDDDDEGRF